MTVFTSPNPLRVGPVDVSVLLQEGKRKTPVSSAEIRVHVAPAGQLSKRITVTATAGAATNKLYQAALFNLEEAGPWQVEVEIDGPEEPARVEFTMEVAPPLPRWVEMAFWIALPGLVVAAFVLHRVVVRWNAMPSARR